MSRGVSVLRGSTVLRNNLACVKMDVTYYQITWHVSRWMLHTRIQVTEKDLYRYSYVLFCFLCLILTYSVNIGDARSDSPDTHAFS